MPPLGHDMIEEIKAKAVNDEIATKEMVEAQSLQINHMQLEIENLKSALEDRTRAMQSRDNSYNALLDTSRKIEAERDTILETFKALMKELVIFK